MPYKYLEDRRVHDAKPEVRDKVRERDNRRYRTKRRQEWIAKFNQTPEFKERNYATVKAWRSKPENKPKRAGQSRRWRAAHPELSKEIRQRYRSNNLEKVRERDRTAQSEYRKTERYKEAQRVRMKRFKDKLKAERLAIAGRPEPEKCELCNGDEFKIVWDHCHIGGHFRGWICDRCNRVLGLIKDDTILLRKMVDYLESKK